jgi:hypothetical protein
LLADYDAVPDIDTLADYLSDSLSELLELTRKSSTARALLKASAENATGRASRTQ